MKPLILSFLVLGGLIGAVPLHATSPTSLHYRLASGSVPAGGGVAATSHHSSRGYLGPWAASSARTRTAQLSTSPGPVGPNLQTVRLACLSLPESVEEGQRFQLEAVAFLNDGTTMTLDASEVAWSILHGPVASIDADGRGLASHVYTPTTAAVRGSYQDLQDDAQVRVLNVNPDDYGRYAKDGLPDDWQVAHFGVNHPNAGPGFDPDEDGQDNAYEQTTGTIPTDRSSFFHLRIMREPIPAGLTKLVFGPIVTGREYAVEYRTSLGAVPFLPLEKAETQDLGGDRIVVDPSAVDSERYYRVGVRVLTLPPLP